MDILYEQCESQFLGKINAKLSREWRDVDKRKLYEAGWREGKYILASEEKLSSYFLLVRMCGDSLYFL
jgi:hypothetical protein